MPSPVSRCMMKPSPPNRATPIFFWKAMLDLHAAGPAQERVLLADDLAAELVEVQRDDLARIGRGEGDDLALLADVA